MQSDDDGLLRADFAPAKHYRQEKKSFLHGLSFRIAVVGLLAVHSLLLG